MMFEFGWQQIGVLLLCVANVSLGALVILNDPRGQTNRLFLLAVLLAVGWVSSISLSLSSTDLSQTVMLGRFGFAFATAMPFTLLWFFKSFQVPASKHQKRLLVSFGVVCATFICISLSPWVVAGARPGEGRPNFLYGPLHPLLATYLVACLAFALYSLWRTLQTASGIRKLQLRYLLTGVFLCGLGVVTTNLLIPLVWRTSYYSVFGPYFTLVFLSFSAHAIIRYRLMEIKFFARKSVVYISAIVAASLIFLALATTTRIISGHSAEHIPLTAAIAIALMVSILFQPLKTWIQASLNRYLYRETYDYQRTIRDASRDLITILDPYLLLTFLADVVDRTLRCETVAIYLSDPSEKTFVLTASTNKTAQHTIEPVLSTSSWLVTFLKRQRRPFIAEETPRDSEDQHLSWSAYELRRLGGEIAFPLLEQDTLSGVLVIGPKLSGDPYLSADVDLISTLVGQAALAMKNAHLYREIVLANERIENILETMDNGVVAVNADGTVILFNSAAERITRLDASMIKGKPIHNLPIAILEPIASTLRDGQHRLQLETVLRNSGRRPTPLIYSTSTLKDRSGMILGVAAVFSDLTRLKQLEGEKHRAERLASIGALASGVAHEIKNPLVAIKTFAELLPERFSEEDFRNEFSGVVIREIDRIDGLIARLRGLAAPPARLLSAIDIRIPIAETLALLRGQLEQSQITVKTLYESDSPIIAGDAAQLKQLFINLFVNAVEAMAPHGTLTIKVSRHDVQGSAGLIVEVIDTGTGIPETLLGKIFDPFVTTKQRGSGLGLSICRGIADAHSATIRARNNINGEGATIAVEFPVSNDAADFSGSVNPNTMHDSE